MMLWGPNVRAPLVATLTIILLAGGAAAALPGGDATATGPVRAESSPGLLYGEAGTAPPGAGGGAFLLEGRSFVVTIGYVERVALQPVGGLGAQHWETNGEQPPAHFGSGTGSGGLGMDAVLAAFPTPGRGALEYAYEGEEGARVQRAPPGDVTPASGTWASLPDLAFRHRVAHEHVAFHPAAGEHVLTGNFTLYLWDVDFSLVDGSRSRSFETGVTRSVPAAGAASEERWVWARVQVTDGRLTLRGDVPVQVRATALDLVVQGTPLQAHAARDALPAGAYRFTVDAGALEATSVAAGPAARGVTASKVETPSGLAYAAASLAALASAGALTYAVVNRRRVQASGEEEAEPGVGSFLRQGREAVRSKQWERAVSWFDCALALNPRLSVAHLSRGLCLEALGRYADAHRAFARAAATAPGDPQVFYHYARSFLWGGLMGEALGALQLAIAKDPSLAEKARSDPGFLPLGDHPMFLALVGKL